MIHFIKTKDYNKNKSKYNNNLIEIKIPTMKSPSLNITPRNQRPPKY